MSSFGAALSEHPDAAAAVGEVVGAVVERVGAGPDVALLFVSGHPVADFDDIASAVHELLSPQTMIGATATAVIGGNLEAEEGPAVSLWVGRVGRAEAVRLETIRSDDGTAVIGMPDDAAVGQRTLILVSEPFSFPADAFLHASNDQYPGLAIVGGVASEPGGPGSNRLFVDGSLHTDGAVGLLLPEGLGEFTVVSQGCRPVGTPLTVTDATDNLVRGLGSRPALERLNELYESADDAERSLISNGLHVGLVVDEHTDAFSRGDFLVRGVIGADPAEGALRIGARVPIGTTMQFQVRDGDSARSDLREMLRTVDADAALVFSCNGRGSRLFGEPDHDARAAVGAADPATVAGMFCAGEFGPIRNQNHIHGFTSSMLFLYG
ncbi:MAG: FIST signal transduction protein [Acidimicrobiales bacterium]